MQPGGDVPRTTHTDQPALVVVEGEMRDRERLRCRSSARPATSAQPRAPGAWWRRTRGNKVTLLSFDILHDGNSHHRDGRPSRPRPAVAPRSARGVRLAHPVRSIPVWISMRHGDASDPLFSGRRRGAGFAGRRKVPCRASPRSPGRWSCWRTHRRAAAVSGRCSSSSATSSMQPGKAARRWPAKPVARQFKASPRTHPEARRHVPPIAPNQLIDLFTH